MYPDSMAVEYYAGATVPLIFASGSFLAFFFVSHFLKRHLWINQVIWSTAIGICLGPHALKWVSHSLIQDHTDLMIHIAHEAARYVVSVQLVSSALSLPRGWFRSHFMELLWLVGPLMLVSWLLVWAISLAFFSNVTHWTALLALAAALTPTDPVIISTLVRGKFAKSHLPAATRHLLNAESGLNDGAAYPFFRLAALLSIHQNSIGRAFAIWGWRAVAAETIGAFLAGLAFGVLLVHAMNAAMTAGWMDHESYLLLMIPATVLILNAVDGYKGDGILAVFMMGIVVNDMENVHERKSDQLVTETMDVLSVTLFFVFFGAGIVQWTVFPRYGITKLISFSLIVGFLRRMVVIPPVAYWTLPSQKRDGRWFLNSITLSLYAPVGVAALFYATLYYIETGEREVLDITTFVVVVSVVAHGVSAVPYAKITKRWWPPKYQSMPEHGAQAGEHQPERMARVMRVTSFLLERDSGLSMPSSQV